jgi:RimJ/RimL family protein N-acetyltransferase
MIPLGAEARHRALSWVGSDEGPGVLALRHALIHGRPGVWGDDPDDPRSVVLVREGDGAHEAFAAGRPEPAAVWLAGQERPVALLAPEDWEPSIRAEVGPVARAEVQTWFDPPPRPPGGPGPAIGSRRLTRDDGDAFARSAPPWALRSWGSFPALVRHGAAFGVPHSAGFAALAWVFDQTTRFDAVGAYTEPRFRRLGLGRAAASALLAHILSERHKAPLWSTRADNLASRALAESLGFSDRVDEILLSWPPPG